MDRFFSSACKRNLDSIFSVISLMKTLKRSKQGTLRTLDITEKRSEVPVKFHYGEPIAVVALDPG